MYDLIYAENHQDYKEIKETIKLEYPQAIVKDASDQIHEYRFSVVFDIGEKDWLVFMIRNGFALRSLNFQLILRSDPHGIEGLLSELELLHK